MTGYQETLTDPSYHRQVVVQTAPHIGNYGVNDDDAESRQIWVSGYVVRDPARISSNWRSQRDLAEDLAAQGIVGISDIDTRALTRHLRERGAMRVGIFSGDHAQRPVEELLEKVLQSPVMEGSSLADEVSVETEQVIQAVGERRFTVAAIDLGIKGATPRLMSQRGIEVHILPSTTTAEQMLAVGVDGVFFSNGPGDPATADHAVSLMQAALDAGRPLFGICFGNQILGRALGFGTYKLRYGHRGINVPVLDRATGKVEITAQNHGFAVDPATLPKTLRPTHVSLFDGSLQGLARTDRPAFCFQGHPEASPGPHDIGYLFDRFSALMALRMEAAHA